jgi:hypothetical protein
MSIFRFVSIINDYSIFLKQKNFNSKKVSLHILKSEFLVNLVVILTLNFMFFLTKIIFFKKYSNLDIREKNKLFKLSRILLKLFFIKLDELILTIILIQSENFGEKTRVENFNEEIHEFENIVVGSGPSGAITAYNLQKKLGKTLIVEKGRKFSNYNSKHPGDEFIYKWTNGGINTTIFKNQIIFSSGSCLGGGSEINSGLFHAPDKDYIERWKNDFEVSNLSYDKLLRSMKIVNKICNTNIGDHQELSSSHLFKIGAKKNNYKVEEVPRFATYNKNNLVRNTMSSTFLKKYMKFGGKLVTKNNVIKIYFVDNFWILETKKNNIKIKYKCKYLFLCCGAIETAKILKLSKIKTRSKITRFFFHPMIKAIVEFDKNVQTGSENVHPYQLINFFPDFIIGESSSGKRFLEISAMSDFKFIKNINLNWKKMSIYHVTFSLGTGQIFKIPFINKFIYFYKINDENLNLLKKGYLILCRSLFSGGAKKIRLLTKKTTIVDINNFEEKIKNIKKIREFKISSVHILGGIPSGENKQKCVVDSFGKLFDYKNLYINDSSLVNHKLLKNPQGLIMAIAQRNVDNFILNK